MSHRGQRALKPQKQDRRDRHAALDLYLPRLERGALSRAECALLATYVREEVRIAEETRKGLTAATRALVRNREATDSAVTEAENRAGEAEKERDLYRRAVEERYPDIPMTSVLTLQRTIDHYREKAKAAEARAAVLEAARGADAPAAPAVAVQPVEAKPAPAAGADEMRRQALANALEVAEGTPWPTLIQHAGSAHQWALRGRDDRLEVECLRRTVARLNEAKTRLTRAVKEAEAQAGTATAAALRLRAQTPDAAQRTLAAVRDARTWVDVWIHLGQYFGLTPEQAGLEARSRRATANRMAEERTAVARAQAEQAQHQARRYRLAWQSAGARAKKESTARTMAMSRMEHATNHAARLAVELDDAARDRAMLQRWEATYGTRTLRDVHARIRTAQVAIARVGGLLDRAWHEGRWGPDWAALQVALSETVGDPILTHAAVRCIPGNARSDHPVNALLAALHSEQPATAEKAIGLVHAYYSAIHGACCPLDHSDRRSNDVEAALQRLATASSFTLAGVGR